VADAVELWTDERAFAARRWQAAQFFCEDEFAGVGLAGCGGVGSPAVGDELVSGRRQARKFGGEFLRRASQSVGLEFFKRVFTPTRWRTSGEMAPFSRPVRSVSALNFAVARVKQILSCALSGSDFHAVSTAALRGELFCEASTPATASR